MDTKQILDYYINIGKNNTKKYKIALVANVRGKTKIISILTVLR